MVGYPSYGLESQNYFSTKQNKVSKASAGGENHQRGSPKFHKNQQMVQQSRPLGQHNGQNLNTTKPKSTPSGQKQSTKHPLERKASSPKPIPNKSILTKLSMMTFLPSKRRKQTSMMQSQSIIKPQEFRDLCWEARVHHQFIQWRGPRHCHPTHDVIRFSTINLAQLFSSVFRFT